MRAAAPLLGRYQVERTLTKYFHWQKTLDKITHNDVAQVLGEIEAKSEHAHVLKDIRAFFRPLRASKTPTEILPHSCLTSASLLPNRLLCSPETGSTLLRGEPATFGRTVSPH